MAETLICSSCNQKIEEGEYVNLDPKFFHIAHFACKACNEKLGGKSYFEKDQEFYCEEDYQKLFGVKCDTCGKPIKEQYVSILGKNYHNECFLCFNCKKPFKDDKYFNFEGNPHCEACSQNKAHSCSGCGKPILDKLYSALDKYWHFECFKCSECGGNFNNEGFVAINGKGYHQKCFKLQCVVCGKNCVEEYYQVENNQACHSECIDKYKENRKKLIETISKAESKIAEKKTPSEPEKKPTAPEKKPVEPEKKPEIVVQDLTKKEIPKNEENKSQIEKPVSPPSQIKKEADPILVKPTVDNQLQAGVVGKSVNDNTPVFPYEQLVKAPFPAGVDVNKREEYLSEAEFQNVFKMNRAAFYALPKWKQTEAKKKNKLF